MDPTNLLDRFMDEPMTGVSPGDIAAAESRLGTALPAPLKSLYSVCGREAFFLEGYHHFAPIDALELEGGRVVFAEEAGGACVWGYRPEAPSIAEQGVVGHGNDPEGEPSIDWYAEDPALGEFLAILLLTQLAWAHQRKPEWVNARAETALPTIRRDWETLFDYAGLEAHAEGRKFCLHMEDAPILQVLAPTREELEPLVNGGPFDWPAEHER